MEDAGKEDVVGEDVVEEDVGEVGGAAVSGGAPRTEDDVIVTVAGPDTADAHPANATTRALAHHRLAVRVRSRTLKSYLAEADLRAAA